MTLSDFLKVFTFKNKHLTSLLLAPALFFIIVSNGGILVLKDGLHEAEFTNVHLELGLLLFVVIVCILAVNTTCWASSLAYRAVKSFFTSLGRKYRRWMIAYDADQLITRRYKDMIAEFSLEEKAFLELFHPDGVALKRMNNETLLPHKIHRTNYDLIQKGFIKTDPVAHKKQYGPPVILETENFTLEEKAIPALRRPIYAGKSPLGKITLRLDRILAPSNLGGSGEVQSRLIR